VSGQQPARHGLIRRVLSQPLTSVADAVVPTIVDAVDINETLSRVDVNELLDDVDLNEVVSRIDVQAVVERLDLNAVLTRVDLNRLLERVDINQLVAQVDVEAIIDRVDINAVVQRVDVNAIVEEVDIGAFTGKLTSAVTRGTEGLFRHLINVLRRLTVGLDVVALGLVGRLLRRQPGSLPIGPELIAPAEEGLVPSEEVSGRYAGPISRLFAFGLDIFLIFVLFAIVTGVISYIVRLLSGYQMDRNGANGVWWTVALAVWAFVYYWIGPAIAGRTLGMAVFGLRVVTARGSPISQGQSLIRVIVLPFSIILLGIGLLMAVVGRERRALHDHAAGTCVVYDWGDRPTDMPAPLTKWLAGRGAIKVAEEHEREARESRHIGADSGKPEGDGVK